ncbi:hypothetical protein NLU13_8796 [Sarocladium strictum]|uniref:Protein BFR2 n=1 Tax=Sarocladium strictum TaxID=5046 RepID=A0AA39L3R1_SARSR|nr:hypothetical protein NLU13_8796 [Sarocladium strictum]
MARAGHRARLLSKPDEHIVKDYDPEADGAAAQDSNASDSESSGAENVGTEHYVTVGKSKLREKEPAALGPKYRGSRVSRDALDESDSDSASEEDSDNSERDGEDGHYADPDLVDLEADEAEASDSEIDSDNALNESDEERLKGFTFRGSAKPRSVKSRRASAADFMSSDDAEEDGGADLSSGEEDVSDDDMDDGLDALVNGEDDESLDSGADEPDSDNPSEVEDDGENSEDEENSKKGGSTAKPQSTLSAETQKGLAIQQQRKTYDGLLNLRIRLQKALVAANTFSMLSDDDLDTTEPYAAAEEAAVNLLNTMSSMRASFAPSAQTGMKRKRNVDSNTSSADIWAEIDGVESQLSKQRNELLEKWSRKTQGSGAKAADQRMSSKGGRKPLTSALRDQLNDPEGRLAKRTKVPRSCAPAQAAQRVGEDDTIYDDADFYQLLLKELVDQRTVESSTAAAAQGPSVMLAAASKDAKTRRDVDRKASKGRKMRFTVHEKLQNFMAPEDRRNWEPAAIDRLFGTLFGQKLGLNEEDEAGSEEDMDVDVSGLRLFG